VSVSFASPKEEDFGDIFCPWYLAYNVTKDNEHKKN